MSRPRALALLLALAALIAYLPVTRDDFLNYDDNSYVTENYVAQNGLTLAGIQWAFTTFYAANWHPLTWLSHMADCELFGLNAGAHHFINALFHAANSALVFLVLWRLTGKSRPAVVVAALFAWHPLHVESVAWVAERKDVLSTFFALLALLAYANYAQKNPRAAYWAALAGFALSLLAKPMFVTFPFVLLLLDYWPLQRFSAARRNWPVFFEKIPFILLTGVSCGLTFLAQRAGGAISTSEEWPVSFRVQNAMVSLLRYLEKTFWPAELAVDYPWSPVSKNFLLGAVVALLFVSILVWRFRRRNPFGVIGWCWFLGTLVPVLGLIQVGHAALADRYMYFPSIGLFAAVVFGAHAWAAQNPRRAKSLWLVESIVLAALLALTERQLTYWRNTETLFQHTLAVTKNNGAAHYTLACTYRQQGRFDDALKEYQATLRLSPHVPLLRESIGEMLDKSGQPAAALAEFQIALRQKPEAAAEAVIHNASGDVLMRQGQVAEARAEFIQALQLNDHFAPPHLGLARIYFSAGRSTNAVNELIAAFHAAPNDFHNLTAIAHFMAANAEDAVRDPQSALILAHKAAEFSANRQPEVFDVLGMAYAAAGDFRTAAACAQTALDFSPADQAKQTAAIRHRLELYQNRQPWRESFQGTNFLSAPAD